jgi:hypothetical protein
MVCDDLLGDCPACRCDVSGADCIEDPPVDYCSLWNKDYAEANRESLYRFGVYQGTAVVEGTIHELVTGENDTFGRFTVEKVHFGWGFVEQTEVLLLIPKAMVGSVQTPSRWIASLSQNRPSDWGEFPLPVWSNPLVLVPDAHRAAVEPMLGWKHHLTSHVAVARIVAQDEYRTTFEVVDALKGTFPARFSDNWYHSWGFDYPGPSVPDGPDTQYIVSLMGLTHYPSDDLYLGTILDIREATTDSLQEAKHSLASPKDPYPRDKLKKLRDEYRTSFLFHASPVVVASTVTGFAEECCTGAGGTFVSHGITETIKGAPATDRFITGGHAYYGQETCGDFFVFGLAHVLDEDALPEEPFDCLRNPDGHWVDALGPTISSPVIVSLGGPPQLAAEAKKWAMSAAPVYRFFAMDDPGVETVGAIKQPGPWSMPLDAVEGTARATDLALFTVVSTTQTDDGLTVVNLTTTFSVYEYDHIPVHNVRLVFRCGDLRLSNPGFRFVAPIVMLGALPDMPGDPPDYSRVFLVPGVLWPEDLVTPQMGNAMAQGLN